MHQNQNLSTKITKIYETEQKTLKESLIQLNANIEMQNDKIANAIDRVKH